MKPMLIAILVNKLFNFQRTFFFCRLPWNFENVREFTCGFLSILNILDDYLANIRTFKKNNCKLKNARLMNITDIL